MSVKILFPGSDLRYCGWGCAVCWVWVPLCPSTSAAGAVTFGAATAMPAGAGDPLLPLLCLVLCSVRWISSLVGVSVACPVVGSTCHRWRFPSPVAFSRRPGSSTGLPWFFEVLDQVFLPPTSGRSFIGGASAWFCLLLRMTAVSLACGLAFAVFCGSGGFPRGY